MSRLQSTTKYCSRLLRRHSPIACVVCGLEAANDYSLCWDCESGLPEMTECCRRCGIELYGRLSIDSVCGECLRSPPGFNFCRGIFPYTSPINKLITRFKFTGRFDIGYSLSRILAAEINNYYKADSKPEMIVTIPLHQTRQSLRGFNQASEIAKVVSVHCQIPIQDSMLIKIKNTPAQTDMTSALARRSNLRGAFSLQRQSLQKQSKMSGVTHIALIDDVVTTMATVESAASLLQGDGGRRVDVWCLARASR